MSDALLGACMVMVVLVPPLLAGIAYAVSKKRSGGLGLAGCIAFPLLMLVAAGLYGLVGVLATVDRFNGDIYGWYWFVGLVTLAIGIVVLIGVIIDD